MRKIFTDEIIQQKLYTHYNHDYRKSDRDLIKKKVIDTLGNLVLFFMLQGSPPKGYAIFEFHSIPDWQIGDLWFYDAWGRRFIIEEDVKYEGKIEDAIIERKR